MAASLTFVALDAAHRRLAALGVLDLLRRAAAVLLLAQRREREPREEFGLEPVSSNTANRQKASKVEIAIDT